MTDEMQHTYYTEKLFFGIGNMLAAGAGLLGITSEQLDNLFH